MNPIKKLQKDNKLAAMFGAIADQVLSLQKLIEDDELNARASKIVFDCSYIEGYLRSCSLFDPPSSAPQHHQSAFQQASPDSESASVIRLSVSGSALRSFQHCQKLIVEIRNADLEQPAPNQKNASPTAKTCR